jgi:DNA-directed RNA polymerase specialized sigma24 family protein
MTGPEIAEVLGLSVNTVYSRLREARIRFERQLAFRDAATRKVP